jgi:hypothetical protein
VIVQTLVVVDVKVGVKPELEVADKVGVVPKFCALGLLKVMVCAAFGVTATDAMEAGPVQPEFLAVTVKVYAVPFVRPVTVTGLAVPVAVTPPGLDVTV